MPVQDGVASRQVTTFWARILQIASGDIDKS